MSLLERRFGTQNKPAPAVDAAARARRTAAGVAGRAATRLVEASAAHRIRLGLTGLAAIFLLVMIAAAGLRPSASLAAIEPQAEPLAVLGVAPGAGSTGFHHPASTPQPSRPSRT